MSKCLEFDEIAIDCGFMRASPHFTTRTDGRLERFPPACINGKECNFNNCVLVPWFNRLVDCAKIEENTN